MKRNSIMKFAVVGAMAAGLAMAQPPAAKPGPSAPAARMHRQGTRHRLMQQLNLTQAQKDQAKAIFQQNRQSTKMVREQLRTNREALAKAVKSDNNGEIERLAATQGHLRGELLAKRSEAFAKFYQILTPAQRAKAEQMHQAFRQRMRERMQQRGLRSNS